ncbi:MAG: hypothetical protein ABIG96_02620 [Candidatus Micrarchaeota archaeon]
MRKLLILSLLGAVLGMLALVAISKGMRPQEIPLNEISDLHIGKFVLIRGEVSSISNSRGNYFIKVCKSRCVSVPVFSRMAERMEAASVEVAKISRGNSVSVQGVLRESDEGYSLQLLNHNSLQVEGK